MKTTAASLNVQAVRALFALGWVWGVVASAAAADATGARPELSISLRGTSGGTVEVGEPFRVAVRVDAPADATTKLELAPARGSWIGATTIEILSASEKIIPATARLAAPLDAEEATTIDAENPANALWWFPAESLAGVVPGEYSVRAKLVIRDGTGWKGEVMSEPASLSVMPISTDLERVSQRKLSQARAAIFADEPAKAAEILNAMLEAAPDNISALALQGALSLKGGNRRAARICVDRALLLSRKPGVEPSAELNELAARIELAKIERPPGGEVPAWTRLPPSVFEPIRTETATAPRTVEQVRTDPKPSRFPASIAATAVPNLLTTSVISVPPAVQVSTAKSEGVLVNFAELSDSKIVADPSGQWAASAKAGSQYGNSGYAAAKATGAPDVPVTGDSPSSWSSAGKNNGTDWLEVTFAKPVNATEVRVRQSNCPGAIVKIEAFEPDGTAHVWWEGADAYKPSAVREIVWFAVRVPKTSYVVAKVKITLNLSAVPGWKQIDAVQLVGTD